MFDVRNKTQVKRRIIGTNPQIKNEKYTHKSS